MLSRRTRESHFVLLTDDEGERLERFVAAGNERRLNGSRRSRLGPGGTTPALHAIRNWPLFNQNYQPASDARLSSGVTPAAVLTPAGAGLLALRGIALTRRRRGH